MRDAHGKRSFRFRGVYGDRANERMVYSEVRRTSYWEPVVAYDGNPDDLHEVPRLTTLFCSLTRGPRRHVQAGHGSRSIQTLRRLDEHNLPRICRLSSVSLPPGRTRGDTLGHSSSAADSCASHCHAHKKI